MKSIRQRLVLISLVLVIVPFLISNIANIFYMNNSYVKELEENNKLLANSITDQVKAFIEKGYSVTEQIAIDREVRNFVPEDQTQVLVDVIDKNTYFDLFFIQGTDGMQTARSSGTLGDRFNRWWFTKMLEEKNPFVSKSYFSLTGNIPVCSIFYPIYDLNNKFVGIMGSDIKLNSLQDLIEKYSKNSDGESKEGSKYSFLIDGKGAVIAHPDKAQVSELYNYKTFKKTVLKKDESGNILIDENGDQVTEEQDIEVPDKLKVMVEKALNGESGFETYKDNEGIKVVSAYQSITLPGMSDNWAVVTIENKEDAMAFITNTQYFSLGICIGVIILAFILVSIGTKNITDPIKKSSNYLKQIAKGDFSVDVDNKYLSRKDEIGTITNALANMQLNLIEFIKGIANKSEQLASSSEELKDRSTQSSIAADEVARAIEDMARGASEQAKDTENGSHHINDLGQLIEKDQLYIKDLNASTEEVDLLKNEGIELLMELNKRTENNYSIAMEVNEIIINTNESAEKIETASTMINSIAKQTDLLALNAAIEAARAGESGKGFAVLAEEIRKLSEQSNKFTLDISNIIEELTFKTGNAVEKMKQAGVVVEAQAKCVELTNNKFHGINNAIDKMKEVIDNINHSGREMDHKKEEIIGILENLSAISQENAAGTEEASASVEEQTASMEEIANAGKVLATLAEQMKESILRFKL